MLSFRNEQLEFRKKEIYHALRAIRNLVRDGRGQRSLETTEDVSIDLSGWFGVGSEKPVECEANVVLAGHSFGGATVVSVLDFRGKRLLNGTVFDPLGCAPGWRAPYTRPTNSDTRSLA